MPTFHEVLITGASSGLGRAIALELARRGTRRFTLVARRGTELEELCGELASLGASAEACPLDVRDTDAVIRLVRDRDRAVGGFDLVLANAGVGAARPARELEWEELRDVIDVNVLGALATLWAATAPMLERGRGTLAGVSSIAGQRGIPGSGSYAASKAALSTWLETWRSDLHGSGLRIVDVRPGFVRTPMTDGGSFPMPFLLEVDDAARRTVDDLERGAAVSTFPAPLAWGMWLARRMPDLLWRFLSPRLRKQVLRDRSTAGHRE